MTTSPFTPEVAQLVTQTHEQRVTAVAVLPDGELDLQVRGYEIDLDEARTPRVRARLDCVVPEDQDILNQLDARTLVPVNITVAYRLPSGAYDEHQLFTLHLRDRTVRRPDDTMTLTLASAEALLVDAAPHTPYFEGVLLHDSCVQFITQTVNFLTVDTPLEGIAGSMVVTTEAGPEFTYDSFPRDWWDGIRDALDALDANLYDAGDGVLRLAPRRYLVAESSHTLTVGQAGTVLSSETGVSRDEWWNDVEVFWTWDNSANPSLPDRLWAQAWVSGGPFEQQVAGVRRWREQREGQVSQTIADRVAVAVLRRLLARARTYRIDAVAAWWLRPEDTVTVRLPAGDQERMLVSSVTFSTGGVMSVITRLPDTASTIGGA